MIEGGSKSGTKARGQRGDIRLKKHLKQWRHIYQILRSGKVCSVLESRDYFSGHRGRGTGKGGKEATGLSLVKENGADGCDWIRSRENRDEFFRGREKWGCYLYPDASWGKGATPVRRSRKIISAEREKY